MFVSGIFATLGWQAWRNQPKFPWEGWQECEHCHGRYPKMQSNSPGFCSLECYEREVFRQYEASLARKEV